MHPRRTRPCDSRVTRRNRDRGRFLRVCVRDDHDAAGQIHCFVDVVGDKHDGDAEPILLGRTPDRVGEPGRTALSVSPIGGLLAVRVGAGRARRHEPPGVPRRGSAG